MLKSTDYCLMTVAFVSVLASPATSTVAEGFTELTVCFVTWTSDLTAVSVFAFIEFVVATVAAVLFSAFAVTAAAVDDALSTILPSFMSTAAAAEVFEPTPASAELFPVCPLTFADDELLTPAEAFTSALFFTSFFTFPVVLRVCLPVAFTAFPDAVFISVVLLTEAFTVLFVAAAAALVVCVTIAVFAEALTAACVVELTPRPNWPKAREVVNVASVKAIVF